jgi:hypothetical protein
MCGVRMVSRRQRVPSTDQQYQSAVLANQLQQVPYSITGDSEAAPRRSTRAAQVVTTRTGGDEVQSMKSGDCASSHRLEGR